MKKVTVIAVLVVLSLGLVHAQNKTKTPQNPAPLPAESAEQAKLNLSNSLLEHYVKKRVVASRWNDFDIVRDALYDMIIEVPGNDSLITQLAFLYYENQKYPSTVLVCKDLLTRNPKNLQALEMSAISYENLGILDRALQSYESLFLLTNNNTNLYKMSFLQYDLKRYQECLTNCDILLSKPEADALKVNFNDKDKKAKDYPIRVALLNLKGLVYKDQSDKVNAKKYFEEALKVSPDFVPARENLDALK